MTKEIAVFDSSVVTSLIDCLREAGYQFRNPLTFNITGFDSAGECRELATEEDAIRFLAAGNGLSLWANDSQGVFVSMEQGDLRVSFDGFDDCEVAQLMRVFRDAGFQFAVDYDY